MDIRHTLASMLIALLMQAGVFALIVIVARFHVNRAGHRRSLAFVRALPWHDRDAVVLLAVFIGAQCLSMLAGPVIVTENEIPPEATATVVLLGQVLIFPLAALIVFAVLARRRGVPCATFFGIHDWREAIRRSGFGLLCYLAVLPFVAAAAIGAAAVLESANYPMTQQPVLDFLMSSQYPGWLRLTVILIAVTVVPLVEEIIFRGVFLPIALRRASAPVAVASISFIFAAMHMHIPSLAPLFVLAAFFSTAYLITGSLAVPIVMHALFNGVSIAAMLLMGESASFF